MAGKLSFQLEMVGGAEVLAQLREIVALQRQLSGIGGSSGIISTGSSGSGGVQIISREQVENIKVATRGLTGAKKGNAGFGNSFCNWHWKWQVVD